MYDDEALYVGARLSNINRPISSRLGRRDSDLPDSDWFIVVLDGFHDHVSGYRFKVNPAGVIGDEANGDRSWNPVWAVRTSIDSAGWSVEMRIPFSQLRFNATDEQKWGVQFYREIRATAEKLSFSYSPRSERGGPSRFGHLLGLKNIQRGKTFEILPFVSARAELKDIPVASNATFNNPFRSGRDRYQQVGADIKYRVTSNVTLDVTVNPDFGQVEADDQQVNLSANEQFFREQRPFFIEGGNVFRFGTGVGSGGGGGGGSQIFYTRRVGRSPQGAVPEQSRYADFPSQSAIVGAAKFTGRTASGWSIGVSEAVTARELAPWVDSIAGLHASEVEPRSNYFVARVKRDFRDGQSTIGGIVTSVYRQLGDSSLASRLRSTAQVAGLDFGHLFGDRAWEVSGSFVGSDIRGAAPVLLSAQRSSVRFLQRPDAAYLSIDSLASGMNGWSGNLNLQKGNGLHWSGEVRASAVSPGFETNDLGFQNFADRISVQGSLNYDERRIGRVFRDWGAKIRPELRTNFGGDVIGQSLRADVDGKLRNFIGGRFSITRDFESLDDRLTRGGPLALSVPSTDVSVFISGDSRKAFTWNLYASERRDDAGAWRQSRNFKIGFRPASWLSGEISPNYSRGRTVAQYLTSVEDARAVATFGRRYIFSGISQTTLSLQTRLNVVMTPSLSVSAVAEPFIASGSYGTPEELRAARTFAFRTFGTEGSAVSYDDATRAYTLDPDGTGPSPSFSLSNRSFSTRSMNATANLRWDWRSGSTLFFVWQHRRANPATYGNFAFARDFRDIFGQRSENSLLFKLSYWFNL